MVDSVLTTLIPLGAFLSAGVSGYLGKHFSAMQLIMIGNLVTAIGIIFTLIKYDASWIVYLFGAGRFVIG